MKSIVGYETANFSGRDGTPVNGSRLYWMEDAARDTLTGKVCGSVWIPSKFVPANLSVGDQVIIYYSRTGKPVKIEVVKHGA